ncbi:MAG: ABC transporter permease [Actinomycetota bacterium]
MSAAAPQGRIRAWFANPWGKPRFLAVLTWAFVVWLIVPLVIAILISFNSNRSTTFVTGPSLAWWIGGELETGERVGGIFNDPDLRGALAQSLKLAFADMLIATPIGVALALGLARWRGRGSGSANLLMLVPLVTPELVLGTALFLVFINLYHFVDFGTSAQVLGHVTYSIVFVVIVVRGRLFTIDREQEEVAMDLGASPFEALRRVLLPLLAPAIFAAAMIVFAISIDDFVISAFLVGGQDSVTVPILIYESARTGPTPALNAAATFILVSSMLAITLGVLVQRRVNKRRGATSDSAVQSVAPFDTTRVL